MSMYGITMSPRMMKVGSTTPACHGSKKTSISWRPRKYHGAFDGFGVRVGLAGSSSGASTSSAQTSSRRMMTSEQRNSPRTRNGQVCTLSSPGPVAFLIGTSIRLPATAPSGALASGVAMSALLFLALRRAARRPEDQDQHEHEEERQDHHAAPRNEEREDDQDQRTDRVLELGRHRALKGQDRRSRRAGCARSGRPERGWSRGG